MSAVMEERTRVPAKATQAGRLLRAMQDGQKISQLEATLQFGCTALHQRIKELRDMNWPVQRRIRPGTNYAEFFMGQP